MVFLGERKTSVNGANELARVKIIFTTFKDH